MPKKGHLSKKISSTKSIEQEQLSKDSAQIIVQASSSVYVNKYRIEEIAIGGICIYLAHQDNYEKNISKIYSITIPKEAFLQHLSKDNEENSFSNTIDIHYREMHKTDKSHASQEIQQITQEELKRAEIIKFFANIGSFSINRVYGAEFIISTISPIEVLIYQRSSKEQNHSNLVTRNTISFMMLQYTLVGLWDSIQEVKKKLLQSSEKP